MVCHEQQSDKAIKKKKKGKKPKINGNQSTNPATPQKPLLFIYLCTGFSNGTSKTIIQKILKFLAMDTSYFLYLKKEISETQCITIAEQTTPSSSRSLVVFGLQHIFA